MSEPVGEEGVPLPPGRGCGGLVLAVAPNANEKKNKLDGGLGTLSFFVGYFLA